ncbi:MAG: hypothetical protein IKG56_03930 [Clostridia bacterium]|nr:hypothetical protein [Clostridia bacterium]
MNKKEKKMSNEINRITQITMILIFICVFTLIVKIIIQNKYSNELNHLEEDYNIELTKAEETLYRDKEIWNQINGSTLVNPDEGEKYLEKVEHIKNEVSQDFLNAIEWAEQKKSEGINIEVTPFEKEGYKDTYYERANKIKEEKNKKDKKIKKIKNQKELLYIAILLFLCEIAIISNVKFISGNNIVLLFDIIGTVLLMISLI